MDYSTMQDVYRIKLGEVFQLHSKEVILKCSHCSEEFEYYSEFTLHVQEHLQQLWQQHTVKSEEQTVTKDELIEVTPSELGDQQRSSVETAAIAETSSIWIKSEIIDEEIEADALNVDFCPDEPIKADVLSVDQSPDMTIESASVIEDDKLSATERYEKLIKEYNASTPSTRSLCIFNQFCSRISPTKVTDTPEMRMLANLFVKAPKFANVCPICKISVKNVTALKYHIFQHSEKPPFQCFMCEKVFTQPIICLDHVIRMHDYRIECYLCKEPFKRYYNLKIHMNREHTDYRYCIPCARPFNCHVGYKRHMKEHHSKKAEKKPRLLYEFISNTIDYRVGELPNLKPSTWQCYLCQKEFTRRNLHHSHFQTVHSRRADILCSICGKQFNSPMYLRRHMNTHTTERLHACDLCDKTYTARVYLMEHRRKKHKLLRAATCRICSATFAHHIELGEHLKTAHTAEERKFRCTLCDYVGGTAIALRNHTRVHTETTRTFECPICHRKLRQRSAAEHVRSHAIKATVKCKMCDEVFNSRQAMNVHVVRSHEISRQVFKCDVCAKAYYTRLHHLTHRRSHAEPMAFECKHCKLGFFNESSVRRHELNHERRRLEKQ